MRGGQALGVGVPYLMVRLSHRAPALRVSGRTDFHRVKREPDMGDVIYVVLVIATFAVLALVVKGVERLER